MNLVENDATTLPAEDILEISLFGPGYGESILVHVGRGDWIVVDSCVGTDKTTPAALSYLESIGVDPSSAVKMVVATHWHDDHIRGLGTLYRACTAAQFVCSHALHSEDFLTLSFVASDRSMMENSGIDEFTAVLEELGGRGEVPRWAMADRILWQRDGDVPCRVRALSPSDRAVTQAYQSIGQLLGGKGAPKRRIPPPGRNHGAVAIWLSVGNTYVLLGADLENYGGQDTGWAAVVASPNRPTEKAKVYKVAHHGAASGDHPQIWTDMLLDQPVAILTPFSRGGVNLPAEHDVGRMKEKTSYIYATSRIASKRGDFGSGSIARTKREVLRNYRRLMSARGYVRVRMSIQEPRGRVDLFNNAVALGAASAGVVA